ncbi:MAG: hypothetical protein V7668_11820 [Cereibacter changlensis]
MLVWWVWMVAGVALGIIEVVLPGYVFLGFSAGAIVTGGLLWLGLEAGLPLVLLIFGLISVAVWLVLRRVFGSGAGQVKLWERDINDN